MPHRGHHPAIESSHALAGAGRLSASWGGDGRERIIVVSLSGRGDKDVETAAQWFRMLPAEAETDAPQTGVQS